MIIIITTTIFIVLSSTAPAICESSLWFLWVKVGQCQVAANSQAKLQTWPLSPPVQAAIGRTFAHRHWYYYSTIRLILIYRPSEGERLSRPRHCSQCADRAQSCVSQWFSWKHKLLPAARFEPGSSRAAGKRVTTWPLRPAIYVYCIFELNSWCSDFQQIPLPVNRGQRKPRI